MPTNRRDFMQLSLLAGVGASAVALGAKAGLAARPLRLLVLGGTGLIGPPMVEHALARGHEVTLFNRGRTNTHLFPDVEKLRGDRKDDLEAIVAAVAEGRRWDAVIDNTASIPRWVTASAGLLRAAADLYLFTSSISAYAGFATVGADEDAALAEISVDDEAGVVDVTQITGENYGALKARCEVEALRAFPETCIVVRPGLIVGPGDRSDRFTYWPVRVTDGGEVLAPGMPGDPVQFIDCRDLGEWYVRLVEDRTIGVFNGVGPRSPMTMAGMLHGMRATVDNTISFTWVTADFLAAHEVTPWGDMPVWVPPTGEEAGFATAAIGRALAAGLTFRPLAVTTVDTVAYWEGLPPERRTKPRAGLSREREREVLAAWHGKEVSDTSR